jgi:hypothetical protein
MPRMNTAKPSPLPYRSPPSARERELDSYMYRVQPMRDRIIPIALLVIGYLLYLSFYVRRYRVGLSGASAVSVAFAVIVLAEALALAALAFVAADMFDIGFGRFGVALLKFAAAAAFCDGLGQHITWRYASPNSPRGIFYGQSRSNYALNFLFFTLLFAYLFELKLQEAGGFAALIGICYTFFRVILILNITRLTIIVGGVPIALVGQPMPSWMANPRMVARPRPPPPSPPSPAAPTAPPAGPSAPGGNNGGSGG